MSDWADEKAEALARSEFLGCGVVTIADVAAALRAALTKENET